MIFSTIGGLVALAIEKAQRQRCKQLGGHDWKRRPDGAITCSRCYLTPEEPDYYPRRGSD